MRIVSLLASATEIVCALGAGEWLVGRSHECDSPEWVTGLPACSEPAFDIHVSSGKIDAEVRRRMRLGLPLYTIHDALIDELQPDVIFAQSHCRVCAVTPEDVGRDTVSLSAGTVDQIFASIVQVADAIGVDGRPLAARERTRLGAVRAHTAGFDRVSVAMLEWTNPLFQMSNWIPELVDAAGARLVNIDDDPDVVIVAPCGFNLERALEDKPVLERNAWWHELRALRSGRVAFADGNRYFNRSGMTVVPTAEMIAEILHGGDRFRECWQWV